jgi:hypothetical protein
MDAIVASLPSATVRDLVCLGPREAAESVAAFLARQTASGSTLFAETVAPLTDPAGPASKSARRAAAFKAKARDAFARNRLAEALDHLTTALKLAPEENIHSTTRASSSSTPTAGSLRNDRAAVLLRLASEHDTRERSCGSATRSDGERYFASYACLALRDAAVAAGADALCHKSRLRLGVAARALGRLEVAKSAFRDALGRIAVTDPARRSVERRLAEAEGRQTRLSRADDATGSPVTKKNEGSDAIAKSPAATDIAPDAPESCRTVRNATPNETRTVEVRLVSNVSTDDSDCGLGVFSTSPRMDPGDVFGSPDGEFASASVPAKSSRSSRCSFCHRALSVAPTPCRACSVSSYCDEACRDEDVAHAKFECGTETSGCWWSVLPSETRLAMRCLAANAGGGDENAPIRALHMRWADFDADARARLAATAAVASHCATRRREHLAAALSPGAVMEATCAVLGNAFAIKSPSRGGTFSFSPDPRSAEVSRLANLRAALVTIRDDPRRSRGAYLDAWFVLSEEAETVALATFPATSRLNHSCDPNAHVELVLSPSEKRTTGTTGREYSSPPVVRATTRATRACGAHEELRVSYGPVIGSAPRRARRERLLASHGFVCACEGCLRDDEDEDEPTRGGADVAAVDDDDAARWGVVLDDARASFSSFSSSCDTSPRRAHT